MLKAAQAETHAATLLITHDLGLVAELCDRVIVMYAGKSVEEGLVDDVLERPQHPYTRALLRSLPSYTMEHEGSTDAPPRLAEIPGIVPIITPQSIGCTFAPRCNEAGPRCTAENPPLIAIDSTQSTRCWARQPEGAEA